MTMNSESISIQHMYTSYHRYTYLRIKNIETPYAITQNDPI